MARLRYIIIFLFIITITVYPQSVADSFNNNILDTLFWLKGFQGDPDATIVEEDSVLKMHLTDSTTIFGRATHANVTTRRTFTGDFDARVDFDVITYSDDDHTTFFLRVVGECSKVPTLSTNWTHVGEGNNVAASYASEGDSVWTNIDATDVSWESSSFRLERTGDTFRFYYGETGSWTGIATYTMELGDSVRFILQAQHEDFSLAEYRVHVDNFRVYTDSMYYINCSPPTASRLCSNDTLRASLYAPGDTIYPPSIELIVDGTEYSIYDSEVNFEDGLLTFTPATPWAEGTSIYACVNRAEEYRGDALVDTLCWMFTVDNSPPELVEAYPPPGTTIVNVTPEVYAVLDDDHHPIGFSASAFKVNGIVLHFMRDAVDTSGDTLTVDLDRASFPFRRNDTNEICVDVQDELTACPGNDTLICWNVYVVDTVPPYVRLIEPLNNSVTACYSQRIKIELFDDVELDTASIKIAFDDTSYKYPDNMNYVDSILTFQASEAWSHGDTVNFCLDSCKDIFDNEPIDMPRCWEFYVDLEGPNIENLSPSPGNSHVSTIQPIISAKIFDDPAGLDFDSLYLTINDSFIYEWNELNYADTVFSLNSDSVGLTFYGGQSVEVCIAAIDSPDYCAYNSSDTCWSFRIETGGPQVNALEPINEQITSCNEQPLIFSVEDSNGIITDSLLLEVDDRNLSVDDSEVVFRNDSLIYNPSFNWSHNETLDVTLVGVLDSLYNPMQSPVDYNFTVDLRAPEADFVSPPESSIVRNTNPQINIEVNDIVSGLLEDSLSLIINSYSFQLGDRALDWIADSDYSGNLVFKTEQADIAFAPGDTVWVQIPSLCDNPDLCAPNCTSERWYFIIEPNVTCFARPNPFTPGSDEVNSRVYFSYPGHYLDKAILKIYNLDNIKVFQKQVAPYSTKLSETCSWDGSDENGKRCPNGIYIYVITTPNGKVLCNGTLTLVR